MTARSPRPGGRGWAKGKHQADAPATIGAAEQSTHGAGGAPPPSQNESAPATAPTPSSWLTTWWGRLVSIAAGVGAIVGVITGVMSLLPKPDAPNPVNRAVITSLQVTGPERLSSFKPVVTIAPRQPATAAPGPRSSGAGLGTVPGSALVGPAGFSRTAGPTTTTPSPTTGAPTSSSSPSTTASTSTDTGGSSTSTSSTGSRTPTPTPTPAPPTTASAVVDLSDQTRARLYEQIRAQKVLGSFAIPPVIPPTLYVLTIDAVSEDGQQVAPQEAAKRLAVRLSTVRSAPTGTKRDPLGMRVTVNLEVEGLRGQVLILYWHLVQTGPTPVPDAWADWIPAARIVASTDRDAGFSTMWVPLPKERGPWSAEIALMQQSNNAPLFDQVAGPFGG